ncbi:MAG: NifU family protein [Candidatus Heimdallarchaeota archaeon]|nr:NifU family protein [Candidatus Heimdallarchaeota archaeon]
MQEEIANSLALIRPALQRDGGDVEFVEYETDTGILKVRLMGACRGCPYSQMTLSQGIKKSLQQNFPQLTDVVSV